MLELILLVGIVAVVVVFVGLFAWMVRQVVAAAKLPERRRSRRWQFFAAHKLHEEWEEYRNCLPERFGGRWKGMDKASALEMMGKPELAQLTVMPYAEPRELWSDRRRRRLHGYRYNVLKRAMGAEAFAEAAALDGWVQERQAKRLASGGMFTTRTGRLRRPFVKNGGAKPRWLGWTRHPRGVEQYDDPDLDRRIERQEIACQRAYRPPHDPGFLRAALFRWGVLRRSGAREALPSHEVALLALSGALHWPPPTDRAKFATPPTVRESLRQFRSGVAVYVEELARFVSERVLKAIARGWRRFWWAVENWTIANINLRVRAADPVRIHNEIRADNAAAARRVFARLIHETTWSDMKPVRLG